MPIKRRGSKRGTFDQDHAQMLLHGPESMLLAGCGYLTLGTIKLANIRHATDDQRASIYDAMRGDWNARRDALLAGWTGPGLPWAASKFDGKAT